VAPGTKCVHAAVHTDAKSIYLQHLIPPRPYFSPNTKCVHVIVRTHTKSFLCPTPHSSPFLLFSPSLIQSFLSLSICLSRSLQWSPAAKRASHPRQSVRGSGAIHLRPAGKRCQRRRPNRTPCVWRSPRPPDAWGQTATSLASWCATHGPGEGGGRGRGYWRGGDVCIS
jgi:hypothetical protein